MLIFLKVNTIFITEMLIVFNWSPGHMDYKEWNTVSSYKYTTTKWSGDFKSINKNSI